MTKKSLIALAVGTVVVVVAAVFAVEQRQSATRPVDQSAKLFPDLLDRINDVASIKVVGPEETINIKLTDNVWVLPDKDGYPALAENVKATAVGIAEIKTVTPKTDKPERFAELGLADPGAEDGAALNVVLSDASGAEMASLLLGERATGGASKRYVRRAGENRTWLATANLRVGLTTNDWVDTNILAIGRERFKGVTITQPDGAELIVERDDPDGQDFAIADLPEGQEAKSPMTNEGVTTALSSVYMEDWVKSGNLAAGEGEPVVARFETFDGLVVTARTRKIGETSWTEFEASFDPSVRVEPEPESEPDSTEDGDDAASEDVEVELADFMTVEEVQAEADKLNDKLAGWAFKLPSFKSEQLARTKESMLTEIVEGKTITGEDAQRDVTINPELPRFDMPNIDMPPAEDEDTPAE